MDDDDGAGPSPDPDVSIDPPEAGTVALDRLIFFSDAVFAIAMTLLVLAIPRPDPLDPNIRAALFEQKGKFVAYVVSFWVIALYWLAHHRLFRVVVRYDYGVLVLNLLLLFCIAFLPYPSAVLGDHGDSPAGTVFYALCVAVTGAASTLLGWYLVFHRRYTIPLHPLVARYNVIRGLLVPVVFLLSIPIALVAPLAAQMMWLTIFVLQVLGGRYVSRRLAHEASSGLDR